MANIIPINGTTVIVPHKNGGLPPLDSGEIPGPSKTLMLLPVIKDKKVPEHCNDCDECVSKCYNGLLDYYCNISEITKGLPRVIRYGVENARVKLAKPFWCPKVKEQISNNLMTQENSGSMLSPQAQTAWNASKEREEKKDRWKAMSGITSWEEIKENGTYHLPPSLTKGRMDLLVVNKYISSMSCKNLKDNSTVWLYKVDEDYKFMSAIKSV